MSCYSLFWNIFPPPGKNHAATIQLQVYEILMFFAGFSDEEIRQNAIAGLGFFFIRHDRLMLKEESKELYMEILKGTTFNWPGYENPLLTPGISIFPPL